jgi:2-keto-4-pentenoate hydratase/2-oxohepta-3-ene-1,7-dioic acid hydratase in catechol pathway
VKGINLFFLPDFSSEIHYEAEIVLKIGKVGKNIAEEFAYRYYDELTVGIDFTARDIQRQAKEKGLPWEKAKAFDHSAPVGRFIPISSLRDPKSFSFGLNINNIRFSLAAPTT